MHQKLFVGRSMIPIDIERRCILQMQYRGRVKSIALDAVAEKATSFHGWLVGVNVVRTPNS
jgi:hypothetical protein